MKPSKSEPNHFELLSLLILQNNMPLPSQNLSYSRSRLYITGIDHLSNWTKQFKNTSQCQTCTKKKNHGYCTVVCFEYNPTTIFWTPVSKVIDQQKCPNVLHWQCSTPHHKINTLKVNESGYKLLSYMYCIHLTSPQLTTQTSSSISTLCRGNTSMITRMQKVLSNRPSNPEAWVLIL